MVATAATNGIAPVHNTLNPQAAVGDQFTATLEFPTGCTPKSCVGRYSDTSPTFSLHHLTRYTHSAQGDVTFSYSNGAYVSSATAQVGCGGLPPANGLSTTSGTAAFDFRVTKVLKSGGTSIPAEIQGTASSTFADPYTSRIEADRQRYCENTWGTLAFTGTPA
jgi:hypothetical protein